MFFKILFTPSYGSVNMYKCICHLRAVNPNVMQQIAHISLCAIFDEKFWIFSVAKAIAVKFGHADFLT